jgi:hypothetical protein
MRILDAYAMPSDNPVMHCLELLEGYEWNADLLVGSCHRIPPHLEMLGGLSSSSSCTSSTKLSMVAKPLLLMAARITKLIPILSRAAPKVIAGLLAAMVKVRNAQSKRKRKKGWRRIVSEILSDFKVKFTMFTLTTSPQ